MSPTPRPLVFLDIDDVLCLNQTYGGYDVLGAFELVRKGNPLGLDLNPELWKNIFFAEGVANLRALHDEFQPEYVMSTSWRRFFTEDRLREVFSRTGLDFVNANLKAQWETPQLWGSGARHYEIKEWLNQHGTPGQPILIIDDHGSGSGLSSSDFGCAKQVVLCTVNKGFVASKLKLARTLLRNQLVLSAHQGPS
jgi:hypothetical protein